MTALPAQPSTPRGWRFRGHVGAGTPEGTARHPGVARRLHEQIIVAAEQIHVCSVSADALVDRGRIAQVASYGHVRRPVLSRSQHRNVCRPGLVSRQPLKQAMRVGVQTGPDEHRVAIDACVNTGQRSKPVWGRCTIGICKGKQLGRGGLDSGMERPFFARITLSW